MKVKTLIEELEKLNDTSLQDYAQAVICLEGRYYNITSVSIPEHYGSRVPVVQVNAKPVE